MYRHCIVAAQSLHNHGTVTAMSMYSHFTVAAQSLHSHCKFSLIIEWRPQTAPLPATASQLVDWIVANQTANAEADANAQVSNPNSRCTVTVHCTAAA